MKLSGKTAVVTGGAGGIGRAVTRVFVREGARVLFVDVDDERGHALETELVDSGGAAKFLQADISRRESAERIRDAAVAAFGGIDVLVNNAHASRQAPLLEHTAEMFELSFGTGFYPTVHLMQACHPQLKQARGSVVNFGSGSALDGMPTQTSYAAAKEAIRAVSRVAANEWAADGIRVNVVCPFAATEGVLAWQQAFPDRAAAAAAKVPLQRIGDPETDIAPVVVFLASDDSRYMTGQTLMADGGSIKLR
ncbi:SDR family NAD(P)-dependent oxidoreductase [Rhodococcus aetherivorans]|uniref:SDR family NAD(P)-dependent oxidoreductase n=1 Tax=Rhodococcus TaxID=1827 RepID=UPI000622D13D|nr:MULTISPECIES: SDR family NAD(P)-dependent oxidoreductase [Rhodococcus]AKE91508.1 oxidoreductase [Rhodococcus aetherivorans]QRI77657.1 SDR family oxidoreductase [Rhodococcus aetherivorans]QSE61074.1 SDR family oxidoreductase [Rhodococcus sp. PSBB066]QSE67619.1 SDR family oxidoreductase [Rhodococcus sp. PSBB049]USC14584.1 SDR family oxidoreductase [Rhodococcus sp. 11-3]